MKNLVYEMFLLVHKISIRPIVMAQLFLLKCLDPLGFME